MSSPSAQVNLRLPRDLKTWLVAQAQSNRRSMTGEIVFRLQQAQADSAKGEALNRANGQGFDGPNPV